MWCPVGRDIKLNYCYKVKKSIKLFCCLTIIHICRVIFFLSYLEAGKDCFIQLQEICGEMLNKSKRSILLVNEQAQSTEQNILIRSTFPDNPGLKKLELSMG